MSANYEGFHSIGQELELFIDGEYKSVYVEEIEVRPKNNGEYRVSHYGRGGETLTTVAVDEDDLRSVL